MPSSPREAAPTADDDTASTLQDLQTELREVEWLGGRIREPRRERMATRPRRPDPAHVAGARGRA